MSTEATPVMPGDFTASLPGKRMGAGWLLTDEDERVLLVQPTYKPYWELPGGTVERDESPHAAAVRELSEELRLHRAPGRLLVVDWVPPHNGRTEGLMVVFDGGTLLEADLAAIAVPVDELCGWALCTTQEAEQRLPPLLARRAAAALLARHTGSVAYLEHGYPMR